MILLGFLCAAFLLGSIPTGVWVSRLKGIDIQSRGSGNVGATNVVRVAGKLPGAAVLAVDVAKGFVPVAFFPSLAAAWGVGMEPASVQILLGVSAVAGHVWNPFLKGKGGKGVATALGVLLGLNLAVGLGTLGIWTGVAFWSRYVSVASVSAALSAPFLMVLLGLPTVWVLGAIGVGVLIILRHRENILRLLRGEESRFGRRQGKV